MGTGSSLAPFGITNDLRGISIATQFLAAHVWLPFVLTRAKDAPAPWVELGSSPLSLLPVLSSSLFAPIQDSFIKLFPSPPIGGGVSP